MIIEESDLLHFGKKGMKWGQRRKIKKEERKKATAKKVDDLVKESLKTPNVLIALNGQHIVTGKEFIQHLSNNGAMNVKTTRVYARQQSKTGPYTLVPR